MMKKGVHSMKNVGLFENMKYCSVCQKSLPMDYEHELCPLCEENELFSRVKAFIRSRDVTEYDVVEEFRIPLRKVKNWIKEGRIEYKDFKEVTIKAWHCVECGEPIQFGSYCQKCYKLKTITKATYTGQKEEEKMRFLE